MHRSNTTRLPTSSPRSPNSRVPQPASTPARPALERETQLVDQVVRIGDAARDEEWVHLLLEELVALEDVPKV